MHPLPRISLRRATGALSLSLAVAAAIAANPRVHAQSPSDDGSTQTTPAVPTGDEALLQHLRETIVDIDFDGMDFEDVIDDVRDEYGLNIMVVWQAAELAGVRKDDRVELNLRQVPLYTGLQMILRQVGDVGEPLVISVEHGIVMIRPEGWGRPPTVLRSYDISDLIESGYSVRRFANTPVLSLSVTGREFVGGERRRESTGSAGGGGGGFGGGAGGSGGSGSGGSLFSGGDAEIAMISVMELIENYEELIQDTVDPAGWTNLGGSTGSIRVINSVLLIDQTLENHEQITSLLDLIRSTRPRGLDGDAWVVRLRADKAKQWRERFGDTFPRLTSAQIDELLADADDHDLLFRGTTCGFNGQRMWFSALTQRDVLTTMVGATGDAANAFTPHSSFVTEGLELIALPLLLPGSERVELDVQLAWKPSVDIAQHPVVLASGAEQGTIDQVTHSMRSVSTTLELPLGDAIALTIPNEINGVESTHEDWLIVCVNGN